MILVLGSVLVKEGGMTEALALSQEHVARSRAEPGCIAHAVHRDVENPSRLVFVEQWSSEAALWEHFKVPASRAFARALGTNASTGEVRATHRRMKRKYKTRVRMPSKLDPHLAAIDDWLAAEPQHRARHRAPARCDRSGHLRRQAAFDRATAAQGTPAQGGGASDRRDRSRRAHGKNAQRGCWRPCGRATPSVE